MRALIVLLLVVGCVAAQLDNSISSDSGYKLESASRFVDRGELNRLSFNGSAIVSYFPSGSVGGVKVARLSPVVDAEVVVYSGGGGGSSKVVGVDDSSLASQDYGVVFGDVGRLVYEYSTNRIKEKIILSKYPEDNDFSLDMDIRLINVSYVRLQGVDLVDGVVYDIRGESLSLGPSLRMLPAVAYDSVGSSVSLLYSVTKVKDSLSYRVVVPVEWLRSAVFPVTVDPSYIVGPTQLSCVGVSAGSNCGEAVDGVYDSGVNGWLYNKGSAIGDQWIVLKLNTFYNISAVELVSGSNDEGTFCGATAVYVSSDNSTWGSSLCSASDTTASPQHWVSCSFSTPKVGMYVKVHPRVIRFSGAWLCDTTYTAIHLGHEIRLTGGTNVGDPLPLLVSLISPATGYTSNVNANSFLGNFSAYNVSNMSVLLWDSGGSLSYYNSTNCSGSGYCNNSLSLYVSAPGSYTWGLRGCSNTGACNFSANRTFIQNCTSAPLLSFMSDTMVNGTYPGRSWVYGDLSASDPGLSSLILFVYNSSGYSWSSSGVASPYAYTFTGLPYGTYLLNGSANNSCGMWNVSETRSFVLSASPTTTSTTTTTTTVSTSSTTIPLYYMTPAMSALMALDGPGFLNDVWVSRFGVWIYALVSLPILMVVWVRTNSLTYVASVFLIIFGVVASAVLPAPLGVFGVVLCLVGIAAALYKLIWS